MFYGPRSSSHGRKRSRSNLRTPVSGMRRHTKALPSHFAHGHDAGRGVQSIRPSLRRVSPVSCGAAGSMFLESTQRDCAPSSQAPVVRAHSTLWCTPRILIQLDSNPFAQETLPLSSSFRAVRRALVATLPLAVSAQQTPTNLGFETHDASGRAVGWFAEGAGFEVVVDSGSRHLPGGSACAHAG